MARPQVLPDWHGIELTRELDPDDTTDVSVLEGLRSMLVGETGAKKLRKTGPRREANVEFLIQVDHQLRKGLGWSLKHFQVVDTDKVVPLS